LLLGVLVGAVIQARWFEPQSVREGAFSWRPGTGPPAP
jgi:hypothetical protein